jgi:hypothetical protein
MKTMFPHFIKSKNTAFGRFVLWQMGHYEYQIESPGLMHKQLHDTSVEVALSKFDEIK